MDDKTKYLLGFGALLALVLSVLIYSYQTNVPTLPNPIINQTLGNDLKTFSSYAELAKFVNASRYTGNYYRNTNEVATLSASDSAGKSGEYSQTNNQVSGVDEADIVKNDGKYIYTITNTGVVIAQAYPAEEMRIVAEINVSGVTNIFINKDKLVVIGNEYRQYISKDSGEVSDEISDSKIAGVAMPCIGFRCGGYSESFAKIYVYDVSDRENPVLEKNASFSGYYVQARMIDDEVYLISNKYISYDSIDLPIYELNGVSKTIQADEIGYFGYSNGYVFTTISALSLDTGDLEVKSYLTGSSGNIYVSENNIYLTVSQYMDYYKIQSESIREVILPILSDNEKINAQKIFDSDKEDYTKYYEIQELVRTYSNSLTGDAKDKFDASLAKNLEEFNDKMSREYEKTLVYKILIDDGEINYKGSGLVRGHTLNQFSMDEYGGNLRIATTISGWNSQSSSNNLYVLNDNLEVVGGIEDLARGEKIYSVRFVDGRAYMVTFRQVDPLFAIDLTDPTNPRVLGYLKITGYSSYLHPYDENTLIGVGMQANEEGRVTGLKVALFDVSNVDNINQKAQFELKEKWSSSDALYDHKAFLFDKEKGILVIPVSINSYESGRYSYWQGVYVFDITSNNIALKGNITHFEKYTPKYGPAEDDEIGTKRIIFEQSYEKIGANKWKSNYSYSEAYADKLSAMPRYYDYTLQDFDIDNMQGGINYVEYDYASAILRSLYIYDVLYTISLKKIKANYLNDLDEINLLKLPYSEVRYSDYIAY